MDGKQTKGELKDVFYLQDIHIHLLSYGRLYSQGWELHLGCNGFTLCDQKGNQVVKVPMNNNISTVVLQMTYPNHVCVRIVKSLMTLLHEHLALRYKCPNTPFSTGENVQLVPEDGTS